MSTPKVTDLLICLICFAAVPERFEQRHQQWHRTLTNLPAINLDPAEINDGWAVDE